MINRADRRAGGLSASAIPNPRPNSVTPTTVHIAQGVTADTRHGVVTGQESGQQLSTMLTRSRTVNHIGFAGRGRRPARSNLVRYASSLDSYRAARAGVGPRRHPAIGHHPAAGRAGFRCRVPRRRPLAGRLPPCCRTHRRPAAGCQSGPERRPAAQRTDRGTWLADPARPSAPLARAGADPVAELLTAAALPPVVHGQVRRSRDLRARIMDGRVNSSRPTLTA
jgi:hypothetical protein